jgi:hypothetical protein
MTAATNRPNPRTMSRFMRESFRSDAVRPERTPAGAGCPSGGKGSVEYKIPLFAARAVSRADWRPGLSRGWAGNRALLATGRRAALPAFHACRRPHCQVGTSIVIFPNEPLFRDSAGVLVFHRRSRARTTRPAGPSPRRFGRLDPARSERAVAAPVSDARGGGAGLRPVTGIGRRREREVGRLYRRKNRRRVEGSP